jgi:hypothetical protein
LWGIRKEATIIPSKWNLFFRSKGMQSPPQIEKTISDAAWLLEQFARMQAIERTLAKSALTDEAVGLWAIANRVCDEYQVPKLGSVRTPAVQH